MTERPRFPQAVARAVAGRGLAAGARRAGNCRVVAVIAVMTVGSLVPAQERRGEVYASDVEFLTTELGKRASALLTMKGINWPAITTQFRAEAKKVATDRQHVDLCTRLVARLRDGHAGLVDVTVPVERGVDERITGPRVHLLLIGERVYVRAAFGAAERQGVRVGMEVTAIDRVPARKWVTQSAERLRDTIGFSTEPMALYAACHRGLADRLGKSVAFELKSVDGASKTVTVVRDGGPNFAPIGPIHAPPDLKTIGRQSYGRTTAGLGYVHLRDIPETLPAQLDEMLAAIGAVPGLILDLRANGGGGCDHAAVFGRFLDADAKWKQYVGTGKAHFTGPLVVIVDAGVVSAGETIAGMLKEDGRAFLIGDGPTAGMSSQKETIKAPSGLFGVRFSVASNKARFNGGRGIEAIGVAPSEIVPYVAAELERGVDSQVRRAEELVKRGFPTGVVEWKPK